MRSAPYKEQAARYLRQARVAVAEHAARPGGWQVSDVLDAAGHQYVDLVMEGGGVLGVALAGYVYVLEELGIRFLQLGGTSAASINALLMAAAGPVTEAKTDRILDTLVTEDLAMFADGDGDALDFQHALAAPDSSLLRYLWTGAQVIDNFTNDFGLHPGGTFLTWLRQVMAGWGAGTVRELQQARLLPPGMLHLRNGRPYAPAGPLRLALVAADITTETKVVFPEMAKLYYADPLAVNPADFVRASMSVPLLFHPYKVGNLPNAGHWPCPRWLDTAGYGGPVPESVYFLDGGIMSNFPIDLFHEPHRVPVCPTFGVKLGLNRAQPNTIGKFTELLSSLFDAARHVHDYDFMTRHPDFRYLVACVDTQPYRWLDLHLPEEGKQALFAAGARAAAEFVTSFDWLAYKDLRRQMAAAFLASENVSPEPGHPR